MRIEAGCSEGSNAGRHVDISGGRALSGSSDGGDLTLTEILLLEMWDIQFSCPMGLVFFTYFRTLDTSQWSTTYLTALRTIIKLSDIFVEVILSSVKLFIVVMVGNVPIYHVKILVQIVLEVRYAGRLGRQLGCFIWFLLMSGCNKCSCPNRLWFIYALFLWICVDSK